VRDLEQALRALGRELDLPPPPDLSAAVGARLRTPARSRGSRRPLVAALAAAAAVAAAGTLAVPQARTALLELLGMRGATVERVETLPPAGPAGRLVSGERVSFAEAQAAVDFPLLVPRAKDGGRCGAVYLDRSLVGGSAVSVVCPEQDARRIVLTQFRGAQTPYVAKLAGPGTEITNVDVGGARGIWIEGAPHVIAFRDASGAVRERTRRLAGDVLLWERGGVTYRLEGALRGRDDAIRIATDLR
jgi:hypothetical protein